MADYRALAQALDPYAMDTGGITPDTIKALQTINKSPNLLGMIADIGRGGLSNLESLVRGGVAQFGGTPVDTLNTIRTPYPMEVMGDVNYAPDKQVYGGTKDILGMMPKRVTQARPETAGMEELGTVMGPGLAKGVAPAVKGYASLLGNEVNAGMTGQPTRSIIGQITPKPLQLDVYHGTPHTLPPTERNPLGEFDASKIGTGEGAQAYGHGIYTAENPKVAIEYKKALSTPEVVLKDGTRITNPQTGSPEDVAKAWLEEAYLNGDKTPFDTAIKKVAMLRNSANSPQQFDGALNVLNEWKKSGASVDLGGNLYKADLPDEMIPKMLDWDKPLSEQPKNVQEALAKYDPDMYHPSGNDYSPEERGQWIYMRLANSTTQKNASKKLTEMGIPGIKYLDEGSRQPGVASMTQAQLDARISTLKKDIDSGLGNQDRMKQILSSLEQERASHPKLTHNFVVFPGEEQNIKILERNAEKTTK
jgi:hypothetical protein